MIHTNIQNTKLKKIFLLSLFILNTNSMQRYKLLQIRKDTRKIFNQYNKNRLKEIYEFKHEERSLIIDAFNKRTEEIINNSINYILENFKENKEYETIINKIQNIKESLKSTASEEILLEKQKVIIKFKVVYTNLKKNNQ